MRGDAGASSGSRPSTSRSSATPTSRSTVQFGDLHAHSRLEWIAWHFVSPFDPNPYVYLALVPVAVAVLRGRPRSALAVVAIILGANVTTELLKHVLAEPSLPFMPAPSWPSGHSTAVMSLALASVLAAPTRLRPVAAALGASLAIAVGYSVIATGMHYPSDVVGGFLVAATWTLTAVAGLLAAERWRPSSSPRRGSDLDARGPGRSRRRASGCARPDGDRRCSSGRTTSFPTPGLTRRSSSARRESAPSVSRCRPESY